ncbi:armadillo-type protein [Blastocladiella britannica]|nr:armadillo-type protein [Blastocladiella britannica]
MADQLADTYRQVVAALQAMYDANSDPATRRVAQDYLLSVQYSPLAWDLAWACIWDSDMLPVRFFGVQTIHLAVSRDFDGLATEHYDTLRTKLLEGVASVCRPPAPPVLMRKMCFALVAFALRTTPDNWPAMLPDLIGFFESQFALVSDPAHQTALLRALLELLRVLPEEFATVSLSPAHKTKLHLHMSDSLPRVLATLGSLMGSGFGDGEIATCALQTLTAWVVYFGPPLDQLSPLLTQAMALTRVKATMDDAFKLLSEVVGSSRAARYQETLCTGLVPLVVEWSPALVAAIRDEDEETVQVVGQFVIALAEAFPAWILQHLADPPVLQGVIPGLVAMVGFPGYPGADQTISDLPMAAFHNLQETIINPDLMTPTSPTGGMEEAMAMGSGDMAPRTTNSSTDSLIMLDDDNGARGGGDSAETNGLSSPVLAAANQIYLALAAELVRKVEWPDEAVWSTWSKDRRDKWAAWRRDCTDNLLVCYYVLRTQLVQWVQSQIPAAVAAVGQALPSSYASLGAAARHPWFRLEALLFAVRSLSESLVATSSTDQLASSLLSHVLSPAILSPPVPHPLRVRQTLLYVVGEYATWFHAHPEHVSFGMQILLGGLRDSTTLGSAAKLLREFCDICRADLTQYLPSITDTYFAMKSILPPAEKQKVVEAISMVIQQLSQTDMIPPLAIMLQETLDEMSRCLEVQPSDEVRDHLVRQLEMLHAFCKGLQASDMEVTVIELDLPSSAATITPVDDHPQFASLRAHILVLLERVLSAYTGDVEVLSSVGSVISTCISSATPPLVFEAAGWVRLLENMAETGAIMRSPTGLEVMADLARHARPIPVSFGPVFARVLAGVIGELSRDNAARSREMPDMVDAVLSLGGSVLRAQPTLLYESNGLLPVLVFASQSLMLNERMSMKAAAHFLCQYIQHTVTHEYTAALDAVNMQFMPQLVAILINAILNTAPTSIIPNMAEVLYRVISHVPSAAREWLHALLLGPQAIGSMHEISAKDRKVMVQKLLGTRQLKAFKDLVKGYYAQARGLEGARV